MSTLLFTLSEKEEDRKLSFFLSKGFLYNKGKGAVEVRHYM